MVPLYKVSRKGLSVETKQINGYLQVGAGVRNDSQQPGQELQRVMEMFQTWILVMFAQLYKDTKNQKTALLPWMNSMVCKVYLKKIY